MYSFDEVLNYDPEVAKAMEDELTRQRTHIELIASENLVSKAVMAALNISLTDLCFIIFSGELPDRPPGQSFPSRMPCTSG